MPGTSKRLLVAGIALALLALAGATAAAQPAPPALAAPVLLTSCGQSPGPVRIQVFLKKLGIAHEYKAEATAADLAGGKFKSLIIVTGASLKGMGAAGVSIDDELARPAKLIAEAQKQKITIVGSHVEGMDRRAKGAAPGDNSDELSIDAVCPKSQVMVVRKDGDEDARFTTIAKKQNIPILLFEKNTEIADVLKKLYGK
ncbi:MAG: hypothetical protein EHM13_05645 [Acidobacteria bacterium]|nr:MAG: hypothetical protein EHM13_05645 [Acidobacteriota bacterium]